MEQTETIIWARAEHPFRVIMQQVGRADGPPSGLRQEYVAADDAVCAEQSVDGAQADLEVAGMGAPAARTMP